MRCIHPRINYCYNDALALADRVRLFNPQIIQMPSPALHSVSTRSTLSNKHNGCRRQRSHSPAHNMHELSFDDALPPADTLATWTQVAYPAIERSENQLGHQVT